MRAVNVVLAVALIASSLYLVRTAHESRRLFADLDRARNEAARLEADAKRLEAERQAAATNLRVERTARERLAMRVATPAVTVYVNDPASAPASGAAR